MAKITPYRLPLPARSRSFHDDEVVSWVSPHHNLAPACTFSTQVESASTMGSPDLGDTTLLASTWRTRDFRHALPSQASLARIVDTNVLRARAGSAFQLREGHQQIVSGTRAVVVGAARAEWVAAILACVALGIFATSSSAPVARHDPIVIVRGASALITVTKSPRPWSWPFFWPWVHD